MIDTISIDADAAIGGYIIFRKSNGVIIAEVSAGGYGIDYIPIKGADLTALRQMIDEMDGAS